jgi:hypothetical protein
VFDTESAGEGEGLLVDQSGIWKQVSGAGTNPIDSWLAGNIQGYTTISLKNAPYPSRNLFDSGRLFFTSADALVPEATATRKETIVPGNAAATVGVENVYQFEPNGVGSCHSSTGCVSLLSSGTSKQESTFLDASADGSNAFILTSARLLPQDTDTSLDIYDARECSQASPCQPQPGSSPVPCHSAQECRGTAPAPPAFEVPATATFVGPAPKPHVIENGEVLPSRETGKPLTNAQKLAKALASCRKLPHKTKAQKKKRTACEAQARKKYGPKKAKKAQHVRRRGK